jgi:hypothetical protein
MKALHSLSNLDVRFVSLVNRSAVRDPSDPLQPQRFLLTKGEQPVMDMTKSASTNPDRHPKRGKRKGSGKKGERTFAGEPVTEQELAEMHERVTNGRRNEDNENHKGVEMSKQATDMIGEFESTVAELRKSQGLSDWNARREAVRKHDVSALQDAYARRASVTALAKAEQAEQYATPDASGGGDVGKVRKQAAELRKADPDLSPYDAMKQALRANPELLLADRAA